jgi:hypothetical protein
MFVVALFLAAAASETREWVLLIPANALAAAGLVQHFRRRSEF